MKRLVLGVVVGVVIVGAVFLARVSTAAPAKDDPNAVQVTVEDKNPWTSLKLNNDTSTIRFAVVSDRTGGHRPKVFDKAVQQINLLQPEFVLSVGDLIEGYTVKQDVIDKEWKEFGTFVAKFEMPFFYVPGNHDLTNKELRADWKERFGRSFYHFTYKNVLFLAVNSEDSKPSFVTEEQTAYFKKVLEDNKDVRWTLVFTHKPLWTATDLEKNGWGAFEKLLEDRKASVFCGHVHRYQKFTRNGINYYQLATTGGGSRMRGPEYGEFDQVAMITVKDKAPIIANIDLNGVYSEDLKEFGSAEEGVVVKNPPKPVTVKGTVEYDGLPLKGATVTFYKKPAADAISPLYRFTGDALTDVEGAFIPSTSRGFDGLPEGEYKVTVFLSESGKYYSGEVKEKSKLDEKYAELKTTPLVVTVKAGEPIKLKLEK
jgi:serine/threonine-protein phosphatase CPPED1